MGGPSARSTHEPSQRGIPRVHIALLAAFAVVQHCRLVRLSRRSGDDLAASSGVNAAAVSKTCLSFFGRRAVVAELSKSTRSTSSCAVATRIAIAGPGSPARLVSVAACALCRA